MFLLADCHTTSGQWYSLQRACDTPDRIKTLDVLIREHGYMWNGSEILCIVSIL